MMCLELPWEGTVIDTVGDYGTLQYGHVSKQAVPAPVIGEMLSFRTGMFLQANLN